MWVQLWLLVWVSGDHPLSLFSVEFLSSLPAANAVIFTASIGLYQGEFGL